MLSVQPALAKSLFRFDPDSGSLSAVMGQSERPSAFAELDAAPQPRRRHRRCSSSAQRWPQAAVAPTIGDDDTLAAI